MTTKKTVLIIAGVVGVLGFIVILFVVGIVALALYQVGNSEAARKSRDFLRTSEKLKQEFLPASDAWWDAPAPEVSTDPATQERRVEYEAGRSGQRYLA